MGSTFTYTTARTLKEHAQLENRIRRTLGLPESPTSAPGPGGLLTSIVTAGLYLTSLR